MTPETDLEKVGRLAQATAESFIPGKGYTVTKFGRHDDGYFHARVTPAGGLPIYVHCKHGSWLAPGTFDGKAVMKDVIFPVAEDLTERMRAVEKAERKAKGELDADSSSDDGAEGGSDGATSDDAVRSGQGEGATRP